MRYFLDFEAEQPSGFIREIGCVREDGEEFFSHVNMREQATAPQIEEVCKKFSEFLAKDTKLGEAQFYFWSNADMWYLHNTAFVLTDLLSKMTIGLMMSSYFDYASWFADKYKINTSPSLEKISQIFGLCKVQTHNALDDANLLKSVYETEVGMNSFEFIYKLLSIYGEEIAAGVKKSAPESLAVASIHKVISTNTQTNQEMVYNSVDEAVENLLNTKFIPQERTDKNRTVITKEMIKAIKNGKAFYGHTWRKG